MRGLKNEIIKPTYDMKKLILLLFIPLVFACSDDEDTLYVVDETLISFHLFHIFNIYIIEDLLTTN